MYTYYLIIISSLLVSVPFIQGMKSELLNNNQECSTDPAQALLDALRQAQATDIQRRLDILISLVLLQRAGIADDPICRAYFDSCTADHIALIRKTLEQQVPSAGMKSMAAYIAHQVPTYEALITRIQTNNNEYNRLENI